MATRKRMREEPTTLKYDAPTFITIPEKPQAELQPFHINDINNDSVKYLKEELKWKDISNEHSLLDDTLQPAFGWSNCLKPIWTGNDTTHAYENNIDSIQVPEEGTINICTAKEVTVKAIYQHKCRKLVLKYHSTSLEVAFCGIDLVMAESTMETPQHNRLSQHPETQEQAIRFCIFEQPIQTAVHKPLLWKANNKIFNTSLETCGTLSLLKQKDILLYITSFLDLSTLARMMQTNKYLYQICKDERSFQYQCESLLRWNKVHQKPPHELNTWQSFLRYLLQYQYIRLVGVTGKDKKTFDHFLVDVCQHNTRKLVRLQLPNTEQREPEDSIITIQ